MRKNYSDQAAEIYNKKGNITPRETLFNLKVSERKKYANNGQWFKEYMDYIVPSSEETIEDYDKLEALYGVVNGKLEAFKDKFRNFCNPSGLPELELDSDIESIEPYPKIYTKLNVIKGEFLKRGDNHKVVLLSAKAIKDKNEQMIEAIKASVEEELMIRISLMQEQMQEMDEEQINKYIEELRTQLSPEDILEKNFLADWEIFNNKALKYCHHDQDLTTKKMETLEDLMISDGAFVYVGWKFGKPHIEIRNRLYTGFHKSPNEPRIHKGNYVWYRDAITVFDAYNEYGDYLSDSDLSKLNSYNHGYRNQVDKRHDVLGTSKPVYDHTNELLWRESQYNKSAADKSVGLHMTPRANSKAFTDTLIWRTHFEFMAFKELMFLTYYDEYNEPITTVLDSKSKSMIPPDAQKVKKLNAYGSVVTNYIWVDVLSNTQYEAMFLNIPRKYEVIRLGNDIYPIFREVPYQTTNLNSPYSSFSLSTKGIILNARNSESVSMVERALPAYFEYLYVKKVQKDELSKYQGYIQSIDIDQIPDELGEDENGEPIRDKLITYLTYLKKTNRDIYSGSATNYHGSLPPSTRSPGSSGYYLGTAVELLNLQNLVSILDQEVGLAMGISPQREAQFSSNTNVSDNQQAITQSHHITEPMFYMHNILWRDVLQDWLQLFRTYCKIQLELSPDTKYMLLQYIAPDGTKELLEITPDNLSMEDIGVWVSNTTTDNQYMQYMMSMMQTIGQNPESAEVVSTVAKAITSKSSPEEIHRLIQVLSRQQQQRAEEMEQLRQQSQESQLKMEQEFKKIEHDFEIDLLETQEDLRLTRELEITKTKYKLDSDRDGIPDIVEKYRVDTDKEIRMIELKLQEREIKRKERQDELNARLKELDIKTKNNTVINKRKK